MKPTTGRVIALALTALTLGGCATSRLMKSLDPDSRLFYSRVRYLITKEESRIFLNLPAEERKAFIEEFWKKRDPVPETEENEFKEEYELRIEEANRLFNEGGGSEPGWLQDRGRIYILLGPPDNRETYPRGQTFYDVPTEIWWYGFFYIVFRDESWNGNYRYDPSGPIQLAEIMKTQMMWKPQVGSIKGQLDCRMEITAQGRGRAVVRVFVPYRKIWFKSEDNGPLTATLSLKLSARDAKEKSVWEFARDYPLSMTEEKLKSQGRGEFKMEVPLEVTPGKLWLNMTLINATDGAKVSLRKPLDL